MSDSTLRCALVYRLEKNGDATCLAKYDYAGQYETSGGSSSYSGERDRAFSEAVSGIISNDPPTGGSGTGKIGGFKVVDSDEHQVTYGSDSDGLCCAVITGSQYQSRIAIGMLNELYTDFNAKFGAQAKTAGENSLSKKSKSILKAVCEKYSDPSKVDKTAKVMGQVNAVKGQMQKNIAEMLKNTEKASSLEAKSAELNEQAAVFMKGSNDLKKQMRWKNLKMTMLLALVCIAVACAIIIPLVSKAKEISGK